MDIAQLFTYLFTLHSLTIYPLFPPVTLLLNTINFKTQGRPKGLRHRNWYLLNTNEHKRRTLMPSRGFETVTPSSQAAANLHLKLHGCRDRRPVWLYTIFHVIS